MEDIVKPELPAEGMDCAQSTPESSVSDTPSDKQIVTPDPTAFSDSKPAIPPDNTSAKKGRVKRRPRKYILKEEYIDIIKDAFWNSKPWILA